MTNTVDDAIKRIDKEREDYKKLGQGIEKLNKNLDRLERDIDRLPDSP